MPKVMQFQWDLSWKQRFLSFVLENLAADPDPTGKPDGSMYYNTASDQVRVIVNGGWTSLSTTETELDAEEVQDIAGAMFAGNTETGIAATYDDNNGKIDLAVSDEYMQDLIGAMFSGNTETRITATYDDTNGKIDLVVDALSAEEVQDVVGGMLADTATLDLVYDDTGNTFSGTVLDSPTVDGATPAQLRDRATHTGTQTSSTISDFTEAAQDAVGGALTDSATLDLTYNDAGNTISGAVLDSPTVDGATPAQLRDRATHTGTQLAATVSDFDTQVRTSRLDQMAAPTAAVSLNSQNLTNVADGTDAGHAVN